MLPVSPHLSPEPPTLLLLQLSQSVNNERNILALANNAFIVRFYYRCAAAFEHDFGLVLVRCSGP